MYLTAYYDRYKVVDCILQYKGWLHSIIEKKDIDYILK